RGYLFFQPGSGLGTFANGDFTANYTAIAIFVALAIPASKKWHWLLKLAAMAFIFYACLSTGVSSQLPVIPIAGGVYLLLIGTPRQRIFWTTAGAAAALVGAFVYFSSPTFLGADILTLLPTGSTEEGAAESLTGISGGASDRIALVQDGFKEYSSHHVLGLSPHGMRSSGLEKNVHNEYASYLFERGPFGFVGLLMGIAIVFGLGIASMKTGDKTHRAVMGGLLAAYALFVINDIAHELSRQRDVWMLVVLIVAYADIELRRAWDRRQATLASRFPWAFTKPRPAVAAGGD
ncbi:MAG: O-antigen ligase family protein, partial [Chloroflexota bacterium]